MAGCPYRNFEDCPQHNKKGGCELWMSYSGKGGVTDANMEGCALVLTPMLLLENANALGLVAGEVNKVAPRFRRAALKTSGNAKPPADSSSGWRTAIPH